MAKVIAMKSTPVLTLGVGPSFAMRWLIPRLASFHAKHPEIEVRLATGGAFNPFNDEWTCGILLGNGDWEGYAAEPLFSAELIPVCAPAIAKRLTDPAQLAKESLLQGRSRTGRLGAVARRRRRDASACRAPHHVRQLRHGAASGDRRPRGDDRAAVICRRRHSPWKTRRALSAGGPQGPRVVHRLPAVSRKRRRPDRFRTWMQEQSRAKKAAR